MNTTIEEYLKNGGEIKQIDSDDQSKIHRKVSFEDQISLMLFACYATTPFSVKDVQEAVFDFHRTTIYSLLQEHVKGGYLERVSESHYRATAYAKDIMNVKGEIAV